MFMLDGEAYVKDLLVTIYKSVASRIMKMKDQFEIQEYMSKQIFDDAIKQGLLYQKGCYGQEMEGGVSNVKENFPFSPTFLITVLF